MKVERPYLDAPVGDNSFKNKMREIWLSYEESYPDQELKEMGKLILGNRDYEGLEYRFLCWLFSKGLLENPGITAPSIPSLDKLEGFNERQFSQKFLFNQKRKHLFVSLKHWVAAFKNYIPSDEPLQFLIGGSFTDLDNVEPSDIDGIVLVPRTHWDSSFTKFMNSFIRNSSPTLNIAIFDFKVLPENFNLSRFKAYNDISLLANKPTVRDEDGRLYDNEFRERQIVRLTL